MLFLLCCHGYLLKPWFIVVWFLAHERLYREEDTEETLSCAPGWARPCAEGGRKGGGGSERREGGNEEGRCIKRELFGKVEDRQGHGCEYDEEKNAK